MEHTLKDALEDLHDSEKEIEKQIEDLAATISNNRVLILNESSTPEEIRNEQLAYSEKLLKEILQERPRDYPFPKTADLLAEVIADLEKEIRDEQNLLCRLKEQLGSIEEDIKYLQNKKTGLDQMQEAYLNAVERNVSETYEKERRTAKSLFEDSKQDLHTVVDLLFSNNRGFKELLATLVTAYAKGGDNVFIEMEPENLHHVEFLVEADIVVYHRNDRNKIRMADLL